jgi:hypothetical protein
MDFEEFEEMYDEKNNVKYEKPDYEFVKSQLKALVQSDFDDAEKIEDGNARQHKINYLNGVLIQETNVQHDKLMQDYFAWTKKMEKIKTAKFEKYKQHLRTFLIKTFKYNPDYHTRSVYHENPNDPERQPLTKLKGEEKNKIVFNCVPSKNLYYNFQNYVENNFEELRDATKHIYPEKGDIDDAIIIYDQHENKKESEEFRYTYREQFIADINDIKKNQWTFLGPFKGNMQRKEFYADESNEILKTMLEKRKDDAKMAKDIVDDKIRVKKNRNEKKNKPGKKPIDIGKFHTSGYETLGLRRAKREECKDNEVEVEITKIKNGGRNVSKSTLYSKAKNPTNDPPKKLSEKKLKEIYDQKNSPENRMLRKGEE